MTDFDLQTASFSMRGGDISLDFVNHIEFASSHTAEEQLKQYTQLVAWSRQAGIATDEEAHHLIRRAGHHPAQAAAVLEQTRTVRNALHHIFAAVAERRQPQTADLATFNTALAEALKHRRIAIRGQSFVWEWEQDPDALDYPLWPVVQSAADLLTTGDLTRVRLCAGDRCGWLFIDASRNRSRRWCDMQDCGNVAKVRRFRERQRSST